MIYGLFSNLACFTCCDGECKREGEYWTVETDDTHARQFVGKNFDQQFYGKVGGQETKRTSAQREDHGFTKQLLDNARAGSAHCGTDGNLFATRKRAGEDEVGNIRAGDQKHEGHSPEHHEQSRPDVAYHLFAQGVDNRAPAFVIIGITVCCAPNAPNNHRLHVVLNFRIVAQFVIEREIPGAGTLSDTQIREISLRSLQALKAMGPQIQWLHSYVTEDKVYCVYLAPDEDSIREHARRAGIPADRVSAVRRLIDPANLN
jgi:hypothetical protein